MGLLDVLTGMRNGPRGFGGGGGGMSPITMALLGLLAYKAVKGFGGAIPQSTGVGHGGARRWPRRSPEKAAWAAQAQEGLGSILTGGLGDCSRKQFQGAGKGEVAEVAGWARARTRRLRRPTSTRC